MISPVVLRGGRADGRVVELDHLRTIFVAVISRTPKTYPAGTFGTPDSPEVVVDVVDFDTYRRVDASTFAYVEPTPVAGIPS